MDTFVPYLGFILIGLVFLFLILRVPIGVSLGLPALIVVLLNPEEQISGLVLGAMSAMTSKFLLLAIPFFILASAFLTSGGASARIVKFAVCAVGHVRGGMGSAGVLACMLFAALSGSSPATVAAMGPLSIDGMRKAGYPLPLAAGIISTAGTLGILIPPSIVMVVYCAAVNEDVGRMFLAGIVPGLLAGAMLMAAIRFYMARANVQQLTWAGWSMLRRTGLDAIFGLALIVLIIVGIYGGFFTPTEASAIAVVYAFFVATVIYRGIGHAKHVKWREAGETPAQSMRRNIPHVLLGMALLPNLFHGETRSTLIQGARLAIMLMFIIMNALIFSHVLTGLKIPDAIAATILDWGLSPWAFLLILNVLLLIGGQFMEPSGLLLIVAPIVYPIALSLGIDPIHLGIIMVVNMEIGMITPPVGLNLFVTSSITGMGIMSVMRAALPWTGVLMIFLMAVTYIPQISLALPNLLDWLFG